VQKIEHNSDRESHPLIYVAHAARPVTDQEPVSSVRPPLDASGDPANDGPVRNTRAQIEHAHIEQQAAGPVLSRSCGEDVGARSHSSADGTIADHRAAADHRVTADHRVAEVWRQWLQALAHDPEAALAAAQAYQRLGDRDREEWLGALETDAAALGVPRVAVYAPLLGVESEPHRLRRIMDGVADCDGHCSQSAKPRAMSGRLSMGARLAVLVEPFYLDFVQVLACGYVPGQRFLWVKHDPIAANGRVIGPGYELDGVRLDESPVKVVVDDLARTIIGHQRTGGTLPEALCSFADLFGLDRVAVGVDPYEWGSE
jgi:hypothetical protein